MESVSGMKILLLAFGVWYSALSDGVEALTSAMKGVGLKTFISDWSCMYLRLQMKVNLS